MGVPVTAERQRSGPPESDSGGPLTYSRSYANNFLAAAFTWLLTPRFGNLRVRRTAATACATRPCLVVRLRLTVFRAIKKTPSRKTGTEAYCKRLVTLVKCQCRHRKPA